MGRMKYTEEFKIEAVNQVIKNGYGIRKIALRLGVNKDSLRNWIKQLESPKAIQKHQITDLKDVEIKKS